MWYLIDKPEKMSSFDVIRTLRKKFGIKKFGHIGTLDPLATGLLLLASENSTKLLSLINSDKKTYRFCVHLDGKSTSLDAGEVIQKVDISQKIPRSNEEIRDFLLQLKKQTPPKFSALHINGRRAYELARDGVDFSLPERDIEITDVEIFLQTKNTIELSLTISSGGYIRSLAPVIGDFFGIEGGYISSLRREKLHFWNHVLTLAKAYSLEEILPKNFLSSLDIFPDDAHIFIENNFFKTQIQQGKSPLLTEILRFGREIFSGNSLKNLENFCYCRVFLYFDNYASVGKIVDGKYHILKNNI